MVQLTDKVFAENLPPGNYSEGLIIEVDGKYYLNLIDENGEMLAGTKPLPPGSWRFLFATKTATEEDARKVVESLYVGFATVYKNYRIEITGGDFYWKALESLHSLLRSKGLDINKHPRCQHKRE